MTAPSGGVHANIRIGDTMLFLGGSTATSPRQEADRPMAFHIYVKDVDDIHRRAVAAGALSIGEPRDQPYGERGSGVKDMAGNYWYIATARGESYVPKGLHTVMPYMHPERADPLIEFIKRAFGGEQLARHATPQGRVMHAQVKIGDSILEMGEAHEQYQNMEMSFYLYVPDADAAYSRATAAGATSVMPPADQRWGDRMAVVKDNFGNLWSLATHVKEV